MMNVKEGTIIRIVKMQGEPDYVNRTGTVTLIDSTGMLHGTWGGLAIIPEIDDFEIVNE